MEAILEVRGLRKRYGDVEALRGLDLAVGRGEFFGLLGPNGAGKSTLMNLLSGFLDADEGSMELGGAPLGRAHPDQRRRLGLVPQSLALYEEISAEANLAVVADLYGLPRAGRRARIAELLEAVGLSDRARHKVSTFSGGMKRRLNLVAGILHDPEVLLCDEPTVGVDPQSRLAIYDFLAAFHARGRTIVYTTHYMEEVTRMCGRVGIIDHGGLIALGSQEELLDRLPFEDEVPVRRSAALDALDLSGWGEVVPAEAAVSVRLKTGARLSTFLARVEEAGVPARHVQVKQPTLEALFLHLTGRSLRE